MKNEKRKSQNNDEETLKEMEKTTSLIKEANEQASMFRAMNPDFFEEPRTRSLQQFFEAERIEDNTSTTLTFIGNKIINASSKKKRIFSNEEMFLTPFLAFARMGVLPTAILKKEEDQFSGTFTLAFPELQKVFSPGDACFPSLIFKNSLTDKFPSSIQFCLYRLICKNGAKRMEVVTIENMNPDILKNAELLMGIVNNNMEINYMELLSLQQSPVKASELELKYTPIIQELGYPKKLIGSAHATIHTESEDLGTGLNKFLIYNGFNKILFESELPLTKKEKIDEKIFEAVSKME